MKAMKYVVAVVLVLAAIIAAQMGLSGVLGFRTAELIGKTAVTALCLYAVPPRGRFLRVHLRSAEGRRRAVRG